MFGNTVSENFFFSICNLRDWTTRPIADKIVSRCICKMGDSSQMAQYTYNEIDLRPFPHGPSPAALRKRLLLHFANEHPGTGKQEKTSRYRYIVDVLSDGTVISITRPGRRSGVDFRIEVSGYRFGNRTTSPRYDDIYRDLMEKKAANEKLYDRLLVFIDAVYKCEDIQAKKLERVSVKYSAIGYPVEMLLSVIKLFLIEQDMNFWNLSGRDCDFYRNLPR